MRALGEFINWIRAGWSFDADLNLKAIETTSLNSAQDLTFEVVLPIVYPETQIREDVCGLTRVSDQATRKMTHACALSGSNLKVPGSRRGQPTRSLFGSDMATGKDRLDPPTGTSEGSFDCHPPLIISQPTLL